MLILHSKWLILYQRGFFVSAKQGKTIQINSVLIEAGNYTYHISVPVSQNQDI